jgi:hypothetical protein
MTGPWQCTRCLGTIQATSLETDRPFCDKGLRREEKHNEGNDCNLRVPRFQPVACVKVFGNAGPHLLGGIGGISAGLLSLMRGAGDRSLEGGDA